MKGLCGDDKKVVTLCRRQQIALKCRYTSTRLHGVSVQNTANLQRDVFYQKFSSVYNRGQDSVFSILTGYELDYRAIGFDSLDKQEFFFSSDIPDGLWNPPFLLFSGCVRFFHWAAES
jgi:hypothetical protein